MELLKRYMNEEVAVIYNVWYSPTLALLVQHTQKTTFVSHVMNRHIGAIVVVHCNVFIYKHMYVVVVN